MIYPYPSSSPWVVTPLTEQQGRLLCEWRYPPPYDIYNFPTWEHMLTYEQEFADPHIREQQYLAICDISGELSGYAQLFPLAGWTRLGLGLHPDLCGQGLGRTFLRTIVHTAQQQKTSNQIDLEVLTWNSRAIALYEANGFIIEDTYSRPYGNGRLGQFHCMVYKG
jgi:ribosomal protein S18 acetylase RimI-like enzyme